MDKIFFLSMVALLSLAVQRVRCDEIHIIPTPDSPCPGSIVGQPCFTLQQYATNPTRSSEISLKLYPGVHQMDQVNLTASNINSFTMTAAKPASVTVMCGQQQNPTGNSYGFTFTQVKTLNVSDITFVGCQFTFTKVKTLNVSDITFVGSQIGFSTGIMQSGDLVNVEFVRSSFVNNIHNRGSILTISGYYTIFAMIRQCTFSNNTMGEKTLISATSVNLTVYDSIFENNSVYSNSGSNGGGGAAIFHSGQYITVVNSNFTNNNFNGIGGAIYFSAWKGSTIANCRFSGNSGSYGGAIYIRGQTVLGGITITNTFFINNTAVTSSGHGGAVYMNGVRRITIKNTYFINNTVVASGGHGGAVYAGQINVYNCSFINNTAGTVNGNGGAVYVITKDTHYVTGSYFRGNRAGGRGGAIAIDQDSNITVSNSTFTNNTASAGGGGAIYCVGRNSGATVSLLNSTFNDNTAAYCGAVHMDETNYGSAKVIGSTFTGNRAVGQVAGSNGGGVFCARNTTVSISKSIFTRNSAVGDAGVMQADECDVTITNSFLDKNTAKRNGGVLYTYLYPTNYTITQSSFTYNWVGGDGGVMFIGRAGSQVKVKNSTFSYNSAAVGRGGVTAIAGSTLYIGGGSMCKKNRAKLGRVASACKSKVVISNPKVRPIPDPIYSFCSLYAGC